MLACANFDVWTYGTQHTWHLACAILCVKADMSHAHTHGRYLTYAESDSCWGRVWESSLARRSSRHLLLGCHEGIKHVQVPTPIVLQGADWRGQAFQQVLICVCEHLVGVCCMVLQYKKWTGLRHVALRAYWERQAFQHLRACVLICHGVWTCVCRASEHTGIMEAKWWSHNVLLAQNAKPRGLCKFVNPRFFIQHATIEKCVCLCKSPDSQVSGSL